MVSGSVRLCAVCGSCSASCAVGRLIEFACQTDHITNGESGNGTFTHSTLVEPDRCQSKLTRPFRNHCWAKLLHPSSGCALLQWRWWRVISQCVVLFVWLLGLALAHWVALKHTSGGQCELRGRHVDVETISRNGADAIEAVAPGGQHGRAQPASPMPERPQRPHSRCSGILNLLNQFTKTCPRNTIKGIKI